MPYSPNVEEIADRSVVSIPDPPRIHLLGTGNVGKLIAHSLRGIPNSPPITLLLHRILLIRDWRSSPREIRLITGDQTEVQTGFDWESAIPRRRRHGQEVDHDRLFEDRILNMEGQEEKEKRASEEDQDIMRQQANSTEPIKHLIVTVKANNTVSALSSIAHRLTPDSSILFLQNGMGIIDEVDRDIFPDPDTRPNYMQGIISHGVRNSGRNLWEAVHSGFGSIQLGLLPRHSSATDSSLKDNYPETSSYLLKTLLRAPVLAAVPLSPTELLQAQLEKLAINAVINPMTSLLDGRNGLVLYNFYLTRVIRLLVAEISLVLRSLPELQHLPNLSTRFSPERLETLTLGVAAKTSENISSMLADVRRGRETEIEYINGYIVRRGEELGIKCVMNYLVENLVRGKTMAVSQETRSFIPIILKKGLRDMDEGEQAAAMGEDVDAEDQQMQQDGDIINGESKRA